MGDVQLFYLNRKMLFLHPYIYLKHTDEARMEQKRIHPRQFGQQVVAQMQHSHYKQIPLSDAP